MYAWGQNNCKQIGGCSHSYQHVPKQVSYALADKKVVCISCSQLSSIAVTDTGDVYSWGGNEYGQLGNGNNYQKEDPCKVIFPDGIIIG